MIIKKIKHTIKNIISAIERAHISFWQWLFAFSSLIVLRLCIENWISSGLGPQTPYFLFYQFSHTLLFFLLTYLIFTIFLAKRCCVSIHSAANILLVGFFIILTPPILDIIIAKGKVLWSFYIFDGLENLFVRFFTFFGEDPTIGITYGVRIEVFLTVLFIFIYSFVKTEKLFKTIVTTFYAYGIFFILGTFPSWISILSRGFYEGFLNVSRSDIAAQFLTPVHILNNNLLDLKSTLNVKMSLVYIIIITSGVFIWLSIKHKEKTVAFIKNIRPAQIVYHGGLFVVGIMLSLVFTEAYINLTFFNILALIILCGSVGASWITSVVVNDFYDQKIDVKTNNKRPLITGILSEEEYKTIGIVIFVSSIFAAVVVHPPIAFLLIVYQAIAWIYSSWPFRLKRIPIIAPLLCGGASLIIILSGFISNTPDGTIDGLPGKIIFLLLIGYALVIPIKDFKDEDGDREDGVYTIPVLFGKEKARLIIGSSVFIAYILSIIILNEQKFTLWAFLFGSISFWIVRESGRQKAISDRNIQYWILAIVGVYVTLIAYTIF